MNIQDIFLPYIEQGQIQVNQPSMLESLLILLDDRGYY